MPEIGMFLKEETYDEWIPYGDGKVHIKAVDLETALRFERKCTTKVRGSRTGKTERLDTIKYNLMMLDYAVLNWKGFRNKGVEIPFSKEAAKKYALQQMDFAIFVTDAATNMQQYIVDDYEETEKNSGNTSAKPSLAKV